MLMVNSVEGAQSCKNSLCPYLVSTYGLLALNSACPDVSGSTILIFALWFCILIFDLCLPLTPPEPGGSSRVTNLGLLVPKPCHVSGVQTCNLKCLSISAFRRMRSSSDKQVGILTYQRTIVNIKMTKNGKNLPFVVFGHPEPAEGPLIESFFTPPSAMSPSAVSSGPNRSGRLEHSRSTSVNSCLFINDIKAIKRRSFYAASAI